MGFYKSFGQPVAKVFLGAVFTYQAVYWLWVKLEADETKQQKTGGHELFNYCSADSNFSAEDMRSLEAQLCAISGTTESLKRSP